MVTTASGCKKNENRPPDGKTGAPGTRPSPKPSAELVARGKMLVQQFSCTSCHSTDGSKRVGSSFQGLYASTTTRPDGSKVIRDEAYIRREILSPSPTLPDGSPSSMPKFETLDQASVSAIIAYIRSLGGSSKTTGVKGAPGG